MGVITICSDWNGRDYYLGALKGRLLSLCEGAQIVDLSRDIESYNISQAAFIVKNAYHYYPEGSIHIITVNSETSSEQPYVVVHNKGHYFIGTDNGMFNLIFRDQPDEIRHLKVGNKENHLLNFPELSVFALAAAHLYNNGKLSNLGKKAKSLYNMVPIRALIQKDTMIGKVIYIDSYSNAIVNISKDRFYSTLEGRDFEILVQSNQHLITKISPHYNDVPEGDILAIFNSAGMLEIAMNKGELSKLLEIDTNSDIRVKFHDR
ncbi:S-adenosyl-l-methionine hydroxide adenosyltransferase family protein [Ancylomarina sp.]|uniref:SAM hydrolase/SAM-dependent halogenase family protein n=1 Tax=Ancylomarina sp. TaxID=1970196 RepID=UPI003561E8B0